MALIEIDGLPNLIAWWIFPWQTVSHNQMVRLMDINGISLIIFGISHGLVWGHPISCHQSSVNRPSPNMVVINNVLLVKIEGPGAGIPSIIIETCCYFGIFRGKPSQPSFFINQPKGIWDICGGDYPLVN